MSRIYLVTFKEGGAERFVRANTLNAAVRAVAKETFDAAPATTEQMFHALKAEAGLEVLDAVEPEQLDLGGANE